MGKNLLIVLVFICISIFGCNATRNNRNNIESPNTAEQEESEERIEPLSVDNYDVFRGNHFITVIYSIYGEPKFVYTHYLAGHSLFRQYESYLMIRLPSRSTGSPTIINIYLNHERNIVRVENYYTENGRISNQAFNCADEANREICGNMQRAFVRFYEFYEIERRVREAL